MTSTVKGSQGAWGEEMNGPVKESRGTSWGEMNGLVKESRGGDGGDKRHINSQEAVTNDYNLG